MEDAIKPDSRVSHHVFGTGKVVRMRQGCKATGPVASVDFDEPMAYPAGRAPKGNRNVLISFLSEIDAE